MTKDNIANQRSANIENLPGISLANDALKHGASMSATAHAIGAAWKRKYGERGALELSEALVRGIHGRDL